MKTYSHVLILFRPLVSFCNVSIGVWMLSLVAVPSAYCRESSSFSSEMGIQSSSAPKKPLSEEPTRSLLYVQPSWKPQWETRDTLVDFHFSGRGWINVRDWSYFGGGEENASSPHLAATTPSESQAPEIELSIRALSAVILQNNWKLAMGFQEIVWGETLGFSVLDIVNPRDYRDPLLSDPAWVRLPVASISPQVTWGATTLALVFTPFPRAGIFPNSAFIASAMGPGGPALPPGLGMPIAQESLETPSKASSAGALGQLSYNSVPAADQTQLGVSSEWGGKVSTLFENGIDAGLIFYHHWNRNPVFELTLPTAPSLPPSASENLSTLASSTDSPTLRPYLKKVNTLGGTLSYSTGEWVFRMDQALHLGQPILTAKPGEPIALTQWQSSLGADLMLAGWSFGAELQGMVNIPENTSSTLDLQYLGRRYYQWISTRVSKSFWNGKLEPEIFAFLGIGNADLWIQPKVTWYFAEHFSAALRADYVRYLSDSPTDGMLWLVRDQSRLFAWVTMKI